MADDTFDWTVLIRLATQGGAKTQADLNTVAGAVDRLGKRNQWSEKTVDNLSKGVVNASNRMKAATTSNLTAQEKAFLRQDKIYSDYLSNQEKGAQRQATLYNKYLEQQRAADQRSTAQAQKLATQRANAAAKAAAQQAAAERKAQEQRDALFTSPSLRYALYDISRQATVVSVAIAGIGTAAVVAAASFESAFTNVQRTLDDTVSPERVEEIRQGLLRLSTEIPKSFQELSGIATLGNQLGLSEDKLESFTDTVAKFSAISGVSAEETAKVFGAFRTTVGLSEDEFSNMASAIELVGRKSAATDQEILSLTKEIGQQAHQAGFTADQVVALAGTLGELRVPPERARGSLTTYFQTLNAAVATGGKDLQAFASIVGLTADQLSTMVRNGQGVEVFQRFIANLNNLDSVSATQALDELGLSQLRVTDTFQRLASASGTFNEFLGLSKNAYVDNTELARQYALVVDDLASRWQIFLNSLSNFGAAIGSVIGPAVAQFLNFLSDGLQNLTEFVGTGFGKGVVIVAATLAAITAAATALIAVLAGGAAVMVAFKFALREIGIEAATAGGGIQALTAAMLGLEVGATRGAIAMKIFRTALITTGIGALLVLIGLVIGAFIDLKGTVLQVVDVAQFLYNAIARWTMPFRYAIGVLYGLTAAISDMAGIAVDGGDVLAIMARTVGDAFNNVSNWVTGAVVGFQKWASDVVSVVEGVINWLGPVAQAIVAPFYWAAQAIGQVLTGLGGVLGKFGQGFAKGVQVFDDAANSIFNGIRDWATEGKTATDVGTQLGSAMSKVGTTSNTASTGLKKAGNAAGGAAKQVRTLVDYANDLSEVWTRAFDIRFSSQTALDKIATNFYSVADATAEAQRNIRSLQADLLGLNSDLNIQQRFLAVATQYGDADRIAAIQANIADLQSQIADKTSDLTDEQAKNSKTLKGNSKAAIANRETITGMVTDYQSYIQALVASGASQKEVNAAIKQGKQDFIDQATQLGFNRDEVMKYAAAFDDMAKAVEKVPKNVTVTANTNPALQALNEFLAKANSSKASINIGAGGLGDATALGRGAGKTYAQAFNEQLAKKRTITAVKDSSIPGGIRYYVTMDGKRLGTGFFNKGGFTGQGGYNEPAGIVHRGEYVIPKKYVNQSTGLPYADALGRLQRGAQGRGSYATGGYVNPSVSGGRQVVDLSAFSIQQLAQVMDKFVVVNGKVVAQTATTQFGNQTRNGDY